MWRGRVKKTRKAGAPAELLRRSHAPQGTVCMCVEGLQAERLDARDARVLPGAQLYLCRPKAGVGP